MAVSHLFLDWTLICIYFQTPRSQDSQQGISESRAWSYFNWTTEIGYTLNQTPDLEDTHTLIGYPCISLFGACLIKTSTRNQLLCMSRMCILQLVSVGGVIEVNKRCTLTHAKLTRFTDTTRRRRKVADPQQVAEA